MSHVGAAARIVGQGLTSLIAGSAVTASAQGDSSPAPCDQVCLSKAMSDFVSAMTSGKAGSIPLADAAEIRENTRIVDIDSTAWQKVKTVRVSAPFVLLCRDVLQPVHRLPIELLLNRDVRHRRGRRCAMPVLFAGWEPNDVARANLLQRPTPSLSAADAGRDD